MKAFAGEIATLVLMLALAWLVGYQSGKESAGKDLARLQGMIEQQAEEAGQTLERLTAERDKEQARLDRLAAEQESKDADAKAEIERLAGELRVVEVGARDKKKGTQRFHKAVVDRLVIEGEDDGTSE